MTRQPAQTATFSVLTVCTGNICRSPAVERLLSRGLGETVTVSSAGTMACVGYPVSPPMVPLLVAAGASADGFVARQVTEAMVRDADLVLPLTRAHRSAVVQLVPAAVRRTFTLLELARLAVAVGPDALPAGPPAERLRALLPLAAAQRGHVQADAAADDVLDPYGRDDAVYAESFGLIEPAVRTIVEIARG